MRCNVPDESSCALITKPSEEEKCSFRPCASTATADDERYKNEILGDAIAVLGNKLYTWRTERWTSVSIRATSIGVLAYVTTDCGSGLYFYTEISD